MTDLALIVAGLVASVLTGVIGYRMGKVNGEHAAAEAWRKVSEHQQRNPDSWTGA